MNEKLRRYTNLPSLIHILHSKKLTLLDPNNWDDSNDSHSLMVYKEQKRIKTLLAICLTETAETYHHWHVFARDSSGVCITFNKTKLLESFEPSLGFEFGPVEYKSINQLRNETIQTNRLPYLKRIGYEDEREFRILFKSSKVIKSKEVSIPIDSIERITLSPWLHKSLVPSIRHTITSISGSQRLNKYVFRSTLTGNTEWKELISNQS